jgi:Protein of unknown function (DUF2505)
MRFEAEHRIPAPVDSVIALLLDPTFHLELGLPDLAQPEVLDHGDDEHALLRLRYEFVGELDPIARRLLGGRRLTWVQELRIDRPARTGRLTFATEADPDRLHGSADVTFVPEDGETLRRFDGEVVVKVPVLAGMAERRIVPGVLRRLDIEATALSDRLRATDSDVPSANDQNSSP